MIQGLWDCQVDAIIEVKLGDSDADTYKYESMTPFLGRWEISINTITVSTVTTNGMFLPFVLSVDRMLGRETIFMLYQLI